jgi:hypothetical protein
MVSFINIAMAVAFGIYTLWYASVFYDPFKQFEASTQADVKAYKAMNFIDKTKVRVKILKWVQCVKDTWNDGQPANGEPFFDIVYNCDHYNSES